MESLNENLRGTHLFLPLKKSLTSTSKNQKCRPKIVIAYLLGAVARTLPRNHFTHSRRVSEAKRRRDSVCVCAHHSKSYLTKQTTVSYQK